MGWMEGEGYMLATSYRRPSQLWDSLSIQGREPLRRRCSGLGKPTSFVCYHPAKKLCLTTHVHWDHIGGHGYFENIAVHETEKDWLAVKFPIPLQVVKKNLMCKPCDFPEDFVSDNYQIYQDVPQRILRDGDFLDLGDRQVMVVHTPGHSPGHCCFYEPKKKDLYSGDFIYSGCLDAFYPTTDPELF